MATIKKPYYTMERSIFRGKVWKEYTGEVGAVPINTTQRISYNQPPPGTTPPPRPTQEKNQHRETTEVQDKRNTSIEPLVGPKEPLKPIATDAENNEKLPEFDIQEIPGAMDKMGWSIAAELAREWFATPKNVWDNSLTSTQPVNSSIVSIDWALNYGNIREKFDELVAVKIYSDKAASVISNKIRQHVTKTFTETQNTSPNLNLDTTGDLSDLIKFHSDWQIQQNRVTTVDTLDGLLMTDLSASLGNFVLYAAIARVEVGSERYFDYRHDPYRYCVDATARLTHVYVYLKDNYSFNDDDSSDSQYLGHWNKKDMILSYTVAANDLLGQYAPEWKMKSLTSSTEIERTKINWDYLINRIEVDKPVDTRRGIVRKFIDKDIYWPVYNKSYNEWREQHGRGGDFMVFSKPKLHKLGKPIIVKLETICRPYDTTSSHL